MRTSTITLFLVLFGSLLHGQSWKNKIDTDLEQRLTLGEKAPVLIVFEQANLSQVNPDWDKAKKGSFVFDLLKNHAENTQKKAIQTLQKNDVLFTRFHLVNMIATNVNQTIVQKIAALDEVQSIILESDISYARPTHQETSIAQRSLEPEWGLKMIQADSVWSLGYEGQGVVIGGQDTGYEWDLSPIKEKYRGWSPDTVDHNYSWHDAIAEINPLNGDTINDRSLNPCGFKSDVPCDDNSHGTHTMGTMVGQDTANIIGVAPQAKWIGCRNMERGWGKPSTYIECFQWFLAPTDLNDENPNPDMAPHVINNSWGCPPEEGCNNGNFDVMEQAVNALKAAGIFVTVSAGNSGPDCNTISDPSAIFENSFSVGATTRKDSIARFSSRGTVSIDSSFRMKPNISAPGVGIRSITRGGSYKSWNGTSMAGPHVAGTVALIISANPSLAGKVDVLEDIIEQTAIAKYSTQECDGFSGADIPNPTFGYGRIDALAAVQEALRTTPTKEEIINTGVAIYPNPTDRLFIIESAERISSVQLFNLQGALITNNTNVNSKQTSVDVSTLTSGTYIYTIVTSSNTHTGKIVVQ